jgi:hypothetical protein
MGCVLVARGWKFWPGGDGHQRPAGSSPTGLQDGLRPFNW